MNKSDLIKILRNQRYPDYIVRAFEKVKREDFIPRDFKKYSYFNSALPTYDGQTISQPSCIAMILELLELGSLKKKSDVKFLEIGSGTGYVLALISEILPNSNIIALEINHSLVDHSRMILKDNEKISIFNKSGIYGYKKRAPYDRILISASAENEMYLERIMDQLQEGGILIAPVNTDLIKIKRKGNEFIRKKMINVVRFVPLIDRE